MSKKRIKKAIAQIVRSLKGENNLDAILWKWLQIVDLENKKKEHTSENLL